MIQMKDSGVDWIGRIPADWQICKAKNIFQNCKRLVGEKHIETERLALTLGGVIKRDKEANDGLQPDDFSGYQYLLENELVFKLIDLENVQTSRVGLSPYNGMVSPAYIILKNKSKDNRFYYYYFLSMWQREVFNHLGDEGVRSSLNAQDLLNLPILNPKNKNNIADYLDKRCEQIDKLIEIQEKEIDKLKEYRTSVITKAVTRGLDETVPMKDSEIDWIGIIPKHWRIVKIKNIIESSEFGIKCGPFGSALTGRVVDNGQIIIYGQWNVVDGKFDKIRNTIHFDSFEELSNYEVFPREILLSMMGTIGKCAIVPSNLKKGIMDSHIIKIRLDEKFIEPEFFVYQYDKDNSSLVYQFFMKEKKGSIMDGLNTQIIKNAYLTLPPIEEQVKIVSCLKEKSESIENLINTRKNKIERLKEYKKSLIYEYVTGKKQVND